MATIFTGETKENDEVHENFMNFSVSPYPCLLLSVRFFTVETFESVFTGEFYFVSPRSVD